MRIGELRFCFREPDACWEWNRSLFQDLGNSNLLKISEYSNYWATGCHDCRLCPLLKRICEVFWSYNEKTKLKPFPCGPTLQCFFKALKPSLSYVLSNPKLWAKERNVSFGIFTVAFMFFFPWQLSTFSFCYLFLVQKSLKPGCVHCHREHQLRRNSKSLYIYIYIKTITKFWYKLSLSPIDWVEQLLKLFSRKNPIRKVSLEFLKGELTIIYNKEKNKTILKIIVFFFFNKDPFQQIFQRKYVVILNECNCNTNDSFFKITLITMPIMYILFL